MTNKQTTYKCGHFGYITASSSADAARKGAMLVCPDCYKAEQAAETALRLAEAQKNWDLPTLTGSDKQVAWANSLRCDWVATMVKGLQAHANSDGATNYLKGNINEQLAQVSSKWWIDNRGKYPTLESMVAALREEKAAMEVLAVEDLEEPMVLELGDLPVLAGEPDAVEIATESRACLVQAVIAHLARSRNKGFSSWLISTTVASVGKGTTAAGWMITRDPSCRTPGLTKANTGLGRFAQGYLSKLK